MYQALNSNTDFADISYNLGLSQHKHEVFGVFPVQLTGQSSACQYSGLGPEVQKFIIEPLGIQT